MEKKQKIKDYRKQLDKTLLTSPRLANKDSIRKLVQSQLQSTPAEVQEKRVMQVSNLIEIQRSACGDDFKTSKTGVWKLKDDSEEYRVMYREGPQGSPFQTLLTEGYADGPVDVCLGASWELSLYKIWWPQYNFPTFKVMTSCLLKKVRLDEQISLLRMKVPWPLSDREVVLDYFELECFEDDLVIVLLNSISDTDSFNEHLRGLPGNEILEAKNTVRLSFSGGFALKKINSNITHFRTIGNLDLKLDFVPPSLINFISRQLLGSACNLYRKIVIDMVKGDEKFGKALEGPLYVRIREHLYHNNEIKNTAGPKALQKENSEFRDDHVEN
ncbi:Polyketide cyclase/dehydrase/lipid transport superfamily protein [Thalictrum thalictroides]|uniref:Polyketide cyclase/dehydrase/lipid transport superfamily protein n=1 Tax=Thalictrum thalictroides TaxID=46969 RepID=A0A7J6UTM0_THATH|nr:Polyketide cyclase/dehydrase/lipid transport superfamily protein [Thalictrum thalictroides]